MGMIERLKSAVGLAPTPIGQPLREAAAAQGERDDDTGWRRVGGNGLASMNERDLEPLAQERMQKLAEYLWQSNLLANRLVELPLAYLLAEGVTLQCKDEEHQRLLNGFWSDPINNWPMKLEARVRALGLLGEQCFIANVREGDGFVRLGYLDPRQIATVVNDPDNPEQPIGVVTRRDHRGRQYKYRAIVLGADAELFSSGTQRIRAEDFTDGECLLFQLNKFPNGSRGRSDLLGQMDWLDAYDGFLFNELDRIDYGDLPDVAEGADYQPLTSPGDEEATYKAGKKGGTENITLEMIKNDDVGLIRRIPTKLSRAAKRTLAKFVFDFLRTNAVIYDTKALFHVDHGNLFTAALSKTELSVHRLAMLKQTELTSDDRIGIAPTRLVVPADLQEASVDLFKLSTNNEKTFIQSLTMNIIPVWYWTDANDWCTAADPADIPGIEMGFLDGHEEPELFVQDTPNVGSMFSADKLTYKIRHVYGGAVTDYRAFTKAVVA